tara:strand:- start:1318 stop:2160 length:843 start_codon:yes stop_codon:yes gene_type:complete
MSNARKIADLIVGTRVVVTNVDSDLSSAISSIKTRLDSDDAKLQSLGTDLVANLKNLADSDLIISQIQTKIDSVISNLDSDTLALQAVNTQIQVLKSRLDSDDTRLQSLSTTLATEISATNTDITAIKSRLDSDTAKLQSIDTNIAQYKSRLDSDDGAIQAAKTLAAAAVGSAGMSDSDLKVVADLRNDLDSEILAVRSMSVHYINYVYTATAGQTTFTGTDKNSATLAYTVGTIQVFLNGIRMEADDYTATDGTSVVLAEAAGLSAELIILVPSIKSNL